MIESVFAGLRFQSELAGLRADNEAVKQQVDDYVNQQNEINAEMQRKIASHAQSLQQLITHGQ